MAVNTVWVDPTQTTTPKMDLAVNDVLNEDTWDACMSNFNNLGGATGRRPVGMREWVKGADTLSASSLAPGTGGNYFHVTGSTGITAIETRNAGCFLLLRFAGAPALTHNATSFILRDAANYTAQADDVLSFVSEGAGNWREVFRQSSRLLYASVGPHAIGGATNVSVRLLLTGAFVGSSFALGQDNIGTLTPIAGQDAAMLSVGGSTSYTLQKAGSGTHGDFSGVLVAPPIIGAAAATLNNASALKITAAPTGATNNYGLWNVGTSRFDNALQFTGNVTPTTAMTIYPTTGFLQHNSGTSGIIWNNSNNTAERMRFTDGGMLLVGDTTNANMTVGLTLNQGANDDEILALKSSDVAHGMTTLSETDTYGLLYKALAASGGVTLRGLTSATIGVTLKAEYTTDNTTKSTAGSAGITLDAAKKSGASSSTPGVDANLVAIRADGTSRFFLDTEGDSHQDVGTAWTNFDEFDDVALVDSLAVSLARPGDPLRESFVQHLEQHRATLDALPGKRVVTFNDDGHHFLNTSRFMMLMAGAIRQLGQRQQLTEQRLTAIGHA